MKCKRHFTEDLVKKIAQRREFKEAHLRESTSLSAGGGVYSFQHRLARLYKLEEGGKETPKVIHLSIRSFENGSIFMKSYLN